MLGTPFGTELYVSQKTEECLVKETKLWEAIPTVPDLQCAPSANHTMRTMPPSVSFAYYHAHDEGMWDTANILLDGVPATSEAESQQLSTLPMGGLGLRSAVRCAPAAYWASRAEGLHMISQRTPDVAHDVLHRLSLEEPVKGCLGELRGASSELDRKGFWCTRASAHRRLRFASLASGHTVGSIGFFRPTRC